MGNEGIVFCANLNCSDTLCYRNGKNIRMPIPHIFGLFPDCQKWRCGCSNWPMDQIKRDKTY